MKIQGYQNYGKVSATKVYVDDNRLGHKESCKVINHSPDGFQWGYGGSGPAQLALALLLLRTDPEIAASLHQKFKSEFIATLEKDKNFELDVDVSKWLMENGAQFVMKKNPTFTRADEKADEGGCTFPDKCQKAKQTYCDCSCGGVNHGIQVRMFPER